MEDAMAHMRVTSETGFDYYWTPAGSHTSYKYGWEGTVRRCVLDAAIKAGKGEDMDAPSEYASIVITDPEEIAQIASGVGSLPSVEYAAEDKPRRKLRLKIQDDGA